MAQLNLFLFSYILIPITELDTSQGSLTGRGAWWDNWVTGFFCAATYSQISLDSVPKWMKTKFIQRLGFFGFHNSVFYAFAVCVCLTCHVHYIYTQFCSSKSLQRCCRLFGQTLNTTHKNLPSRVPHFEREISGTNRVKKVARKVNQSETFRALKRFLKYFYII